MLGLFLLIKMKSLCVLFVNVMLYQKFDKIFGLHKLYALQGFCFKTEGVTC